MKDASLSLMAGGKSFADAKSEDFFVGDELNEEYKYIGSSEEIFRSNT